MNCYIRLFSSILPGNEVEVAQEVILPVKLTGKHCLPPKRKDWVTTYARVEVQLCGKKYWVHPDQLCDRKGEELNPNREEQLRKFLGFADGDWGNLLECPTCQAEPGKPCKTPKGREKTSCHENRPFFI